MAVYVTAVLNVGFVRHTLSALEPAGLRGYFVIVALIVIIFALTWLLFASAAHPFALRGVIILAVLVGAPLSYAASEYGLGVDHRLLATALETDRAEAGDLITLKLIVWCLILGVMPAWFVWRLNIAWGSLAERSWANAKAMALSTALLASFLAVTYGDLVSLFRENRRLLSMVVPLNGIVAVAQYATRNPRVPATGAALQRIAPASPLKGAATADNASITVFVVGETARGDHFTINGYGMPTSPRLASTPRLINFTNATSCATLTADSLPCMFSGLGRSGNVKNISYSRENLLDVLKGAGFDVVWIDNQAGCKGVCARIETIVTTHRTDPRFCASGECHDEILVDALAERLKTIQRDTVIVLHMMGSHGPSYWKRYPAAFERFKPTCQSSAFSSCTREQIVAAYDNTIHYTDHVLGSIIDLLGASGRPAAMLYASDHGESLGERGVYLHGVPFLFAPRAQTHIPFLAWLSDSYRARFGLGRDCLVGSHAEPVSHDHLFHTVLGLLDLSTPARDPQLDLTRGCRAPG